MKSAIVYVPMSADIVHPGHVQILVEAQKHGKVVIGLLSDEAIKTKKGEYPIMNYDERREVVNQLRGVHRVIVQTSPDYRPNLLKIKPQFVVHGDDWSNDARKSVLDTIMAWDGKLIETDYNSRQTSSSSIKQRIVDRSM